MGEEPEQVAFIDAEARPSGREKVTFKEIVLSHLRKIGTYASVEFRGGYWEERSNPDVNRNDPIKTYVPDSREVYSNSIEYLYDILYPHFDTQMKKDGKDLVKELEDTYKDNTIIKEEDREGETIEEGNEEERKEKRIFGNLDNRISYRKERVKINRKLFRALCCFLKRIDYFKGKVFDEVTG